MKILAIGAHPDDIEMDCGGTLALYAKRGDEVSMAHICSGDKGHMEIPQNELARIRANETEKAAGLISAKVFHGTTGDGEIEELLKYRDIIIDIIRGADPDVIITHAPVDYHADHRIVSNLTVDASFMASVPHIKTKNRAIEKVPQIYFMDTYGGVNFQPQEYVDITEVMDIKIEMMKMHKSQIDWLKRHDHMDILDCLETVAKYRGLQCGVKYAEGFARYSSALRTVPGHFLP